MNKNNAKDVQTSAGILLYRKNIVKNVYQVMLVSSYSNPQKLMKKVWNIPKGHVQKGQNLTQTAIRQFEEETGIKLTEQQKSHLDYIGLCCTQKGKHVHIFGLEKDVNGGKEKVNIKSIMIKTERPPHSGHFILIPQTASGKYFDIDNASKYIFNYQQIILDRLKEKLK